jgi:inner membrane protein involved in colicin E2 resistance
VLQGWDNFYLMIGSAAAGLIGLLFVVVSLTTGVERAQVLRGQALYMTPTALNFAVVLAVSAVMMAPGLGVTARAAAFGLIASIGLTNLARACLGIARLTVDGETVHWTDLWMYGVAPTLLYVLLVAVAVAAGLGAGWAPYAMAALLLALLLTAIRNAWDLVTWIAPKRDGAPPPS